MATTQQSSKRPFGRKSSHGSSRKVKRTKREKNIRAGGSSEEVLEADIKSLLHSVDSPEQGDSAILPELWTEVKVHIDSLSSTGDGLGRTASQSHLVFAVPFTVPGDVVVAKVIAHVNGTAPYIRADFVKVIEPSPHRDDSLINCRYFGECSGCQFQMLPYSYQLAHKKTIVERAYHNFSGLSSELIPSVGDTVGSPLQYGYRTKLTPHFDGPKFARALARKGEKAHFDEVPPIGFNKKQMRKTIDIEECPISTTSVQMGLRRERERVAKELASYSKGATLLLRESTERVQSSHAPPEVDIPGVDEATHTLYERVGTRLYAKTCVTDPRATFAEYVDDFQIKNTANSFFQNNNSILSTFVSYIRDHVMPVTNLSTRTKMTNLIDAYSGSGLFSITLSTLFERTIGIDIDNAAIAQARSNVEANLEKFTTRGRAGEEGYRPKSASKNPLAKVESTSPNDERPRGSDFDSSRIQTHRGDPEVVIENDNQNTSFKPEFIAADASQLFASVRSFDPAETVVILDPPRKGCDESFLMQLLEFGPERIVYVSCNVHTQAGDIGMLLSGATKPVQKVQHENASRERHDRDSSSGPNIGAKTQAAYRFESLRGFDFFPQTSHVESVAVLSRIRL